MPTDAEHISQASHNITFLKTFYSQYRYNDWSITVAFYSALHIIEGVIHRKQKINYRGDSLQISHASELFGRIKQANLPLPKNVQGGYKSPHTARKIIVDHNYSTISMEYSMLYKKSHTARYKRYIWQNPETDRIARDPLQAIIAWSNQELSTSLAF